jgi:hypothetical protein
MPRNKGIKKSIPKKHNPQKGMLILSKLHKHYRENPEYLKKIFYLVENKKLSLLDFIANIYSKENSVFYKVNNKFFIINHDYKNQLRSYSKKYFDAFKRDELIFITFDEREISTTVGQLNFLKWVIDNEIDKYLEDNLKSIEKSMLDKYPNVEIKSEC